HAYLPPTDHVRDLDGKLENDHRLFLGNHGDVVRVDLRSRILASYFIHRLPRLLHLHGDEVHELFYDVELDLREFPAFDLRDGYGIAAEHRLQNAENEFCVENHYEEAFEIIRDDDVHVRGQRKGLYELPILRVLRGSDIYVHFPLKKEGESRSQRFRQSVRDELEGRQSLLSALRVLGEVEYLGIGALGGGCRRFRLPFLCRLDVPV